MRRAITYQARKALGAATEEQKEGISLDTLDRALAGKIKRLNYGERCEYEIMTESEEQKIVDWLKASAGYCGILKEQQGTAGLRCARTAVAAARPRAQWLRRCAALSASKSRQGSAEFRRAAPRPRLCCSHTRERLRRRLL